MKTRALSFVAQAMFVVTLAPALHLLGDDGPPNWPQFHGPERSNMSTERGLMQEWPPDGPPLVWKYSGCGEGYSGVAIAESMVFTAGDFDDVELVSALDLNGNKLWTSQNGEAWQGSCPGSRTTPTYSEGVLYHMNPTGRLAAYEAETGKPIWSVDLRTRFKAKYGIWALAENVIVEGDKVLCMPGGPQGRIVALDKRSGETIWANTELAHSAAYCSPVVVTHGKVRQLITMTQRSVVGVEVATGQLLWSAPFVPTYPQNALAPAYHDGHVFVACGHSSGGSLLKIAPDSRSATTVWHRKDLDNCHGGSLILDGRLFGCGCRSGGKHFYCVDFLTGKTVKLDKTLGKVGITYADRRVYCLNHQGTVSLLAITADGFDIVSQFKLKRKPANSYLAHPVVCGGRLYVRCDQELFAYDIRAN